MQRLRDAGNSLVVVEHDPQIMLAADRILDMGPGAGEHGGADRLLRHAGASCCAIADSLTGAVPARRSPRRRDRARRRVAARRARDGARIALELHGAREHNLKNVDVDIPLQRLVCVTGVSGSGKSHAGRRTCCTRRCCKPQRQADRGARRVRRAARRRADRRRGAWSTRRPIGRTTRSNPASYVGAFDAIRKLFAAEPLAQAAQATRAGTFSFNSGNGRCPTCSGNGFEHVEMQFLSDVYLRCPDCDGRRYRAEMLEMHVATARPAARLSIADVLDLTVTEALRVLRATRRRSPRACSRSPTWASST